MWRGIEGRRGQQSEAMRYGANDEDESNGDEGDSIRALRSRSAFFTTHNQMLARSISSYALSMCTFIFWSTSSLRKAQVSSSSSFCSVAVVVKEAEGDVQEEPLLPNSEQYVGGQMLFRRPK